MPPPRPQSEDAQLREFGFSIEARPGKGQARWRRKGKVLTQEQALKVVRREREERDAARDAGIERG